MGKRVKFDFEIDFTNDGGIQGRDFRLYPMNERRQVKRNEHDWQ